MNRIPGPVLFLCILVLVIVPAVLQQTVSSNAAAPLTNERATPVEAVTDTSALPLFKSNYMLLQGGTGTSSLVGEWRFDEASGSSAADSSGRSLNGTIQNGSSWTSGRYRAGLQFDGVNGYVQVGAQPALVMTNAMSVSAWINPTGTGASGLGIIVNKEGEYEIARFYDGTIRWALANSAPGWTFIDTGFVAPVNQWTHITLTYNNGEVRTYANGNLVHTYLGSGAIGDVGTSMNDFRIGGRQSADQKFMGRIDEVSIYNQALTAADVTKLSQGSMPRNLALRRTATQSSTGWDSPASLAVDGNTDGDWFHGSVSHTNENAQAWWQVDLGSVQQIENVSVFMMTVCCSSHDNFDVKVSSDGVNWTSYYVAGPVDQVTAPFNRAARYVRVQLRGSGYLALGEVQVWGVPGAVMPGVVQAEDFDDGGEGITYHDLTAANEGGLYRTTAVDISTCAANTYVIGWNGTAEWTQYSINVPTPGYYSFQAVIGEESSGSLHVEFDGVDKTGPINIPNTGGWCTFQTISKSKIFLGAGQHTMRVVTDNVGVVLDSFRLVAEFGPYTGTPATIPGTIQVEAYDLGDEGVAYHDRSPNNETGSTFRAPTGVDVWETGIGYAQAGEWLLYTVNVATTGTYTVGASVGSIAAGGSIHIEVDGVDKTGPMAVPNTGGWGSYQTITKSGVQLTAGAHTIRLVLDINSGNGYVANFDFINFTLAPPPPSNQLPKANAGGPYSITTATPLQFSGAASTDPDGSISTYAWNFGDGQSGTGVSPSHAYAASGVYTVTLSVTDNAGGAGSATTSVTVVPPPVAPSALTATAASASQINLSWSDNSTNEIAFQIERTTQASGAYTTVATVGAGSTAWSDTGVSAGVTYLYRVRSVIAAGYSAYSNVTSVATMAAPTAGARYSLSLNGVYSYVVVPNNSVLNITGPITVEAWIKTNSTASQGIVERYNWFSTDDGGFALRLEQGRLQFYSIRNSSSYDSVLGNTPVSVGVWHHVVGVFDGTQLRVYLDGREDGAKASTIAPGSGTQSVKIGARGNDGANCFNGLIDEVRISSGVQYRGNFTAMSLHDSGDVITDPGAGQRGLWAFDTATANDDTGNGNNGTLVGGAVITTVTMGQNTKYENLMASSSSAALIDRQVVIGFDEFVNKKVSNQYPDAKFAWVPAVNYEGPPYFTFATNWMPNHGETGARLTRIPEIGITVGQTVLQGRYENFSVDFPTPASNISFEGIGVDNFNTLLSPCATAAVVDVYFTTNPANEIPFRISLCGRNIGVDPPEKPLVYDLNKNGIKNARKLVFHSILDVIGGVDFDTFKFTVPVTPAVNITDAKADTANRVPGVLNGTLQKSLIGSRVKLTATGNSPGRYQWNFTGPVRDPFFEDNGRTVSFTTFDDDRDAETQKTVYRVTAKVTFTDSQVSTATAEASVNIDVHVPTVPVYSGIAADSTIEKGPTTTFDRPSAVIWQMGGSNPDTQKPGMTFSARAQIPDGRYLSDLNDASITFQQAINMMRKVRDSWGKESCKTTREKLEDAPVGSDGQRVDTGWRHDNSISDRVQNYAGSTKSFSESAVVSGIPNARSLSIDFKQGVEGIKFNNMNIGTNTSNDIPGLSEALIDVDAVKVDDWYQTYVMYSSGGGTFSRPLATVEWRWGGTMVFDTTHQERPLYDPPHSKLPVGEPVSDYYIVTGSTSSIGKVDQKPIRTKVAGVINSAEVAWVQCPQGLGKPHPTGIAADLHPITDNQHGFVQLLYWDVFKRLPTRSDALPTLEPTEDRKGYHFWASTIIKHGFNDEAIDGHRVHLGMAFLFAQEFVDMHQGLNDPLKNLAAGRHTPEYNAAFVLACYRVFLQRAPGEGRDNGSTNGYFIWLAKLNNMDAEGVRISDDYAYFETVHAFLVSQEYQDRVNDRIIGLVPKLGSYIDDVDHKFNSDIPTFTPSPQP